MVAPSPLSLPLILLVLLAILPTPHAKKGTVKFDTISSFQFVDRFVFDPTPADIRIGENEENKEFIREKFGMCEC